MDTIKIVETENGIHVELFPFGKLKAEDMQQAQVFETYLRAAMRQGYVQAQADIRNALGVRQ